MDAGQEVSMCAALAVFLSEPTGAFYTQRRTKNGADGFFSWKACLRFKDLVKV